MQEGGEFGRYYEDGRTSRAPRPSTPTGRRAAPAARRPVGVEVAPGAGQSRLRREIQQALGSRSALRRALLLREILGPPKALQTGDDAHPRPTPNQQQGNSRPVQNGQHQNGSQQNGVSTVPHRNGHGYLSPGAAEDRPSAVALPAASPAPPSPGAADPSVARHEPPTTAQSAQSDKARPPSSAGLTASIVEATASAIRRLMRRVGKWR